ncbi:hypothetical protein EPUS_09176 [Endocarpon pusillum Z07020]|uniref:Uncharacterized protein n=1 Tax=Endocarpon pusillum (strain Z07020 / HMAS-L-300199) TaxID=1263415 RepID=U1I016_ENDPU|nr:uncharacterized protein EPUS_09176 [Endocarpon pusillum Z07020]ERF76540.1 hypothetical protein EPUS_09176 [Endocarpon pusillum Z07020]
MVRRSSISDEPEVRPAKRQSDTDNDNDNDDAESGLESECEGSRLRPRRQRKSPAGAARRPVKRRRAGRAETKQQRQIAQNTLTPPSTSAPTGSSELETEILEDEDENSQVSIHSSALLLKWKDIPYPGLPQVGYAFSYASGPIRFLKIPSSAPKSLAAHWRPPQNYAAYVIYSLNPAPNMDNKLQGLEMVNELAVHGFVEDENCDVREEIVQGMRALTFHKGSVAVSVTKLGGAPKFKGYWPGSKLDDEDKKMISAKLQSVMHDCAVANHKPSKWSTTTSPRSSSSTTSPKSAKTSPDSTAPRSTTITASQEEAETAHSTPSSSSGASASGGIPTSLEASGLIKFIKVHWRHSKCIADAIHLIRPARLTTNLRSSTGSADTEEEDDFKAVVVWSNLKEKKEGVSLLEGMIAQRLGGSEEDFLEGVTVCQEVIDDDDEEEGKGEGEKWAVLRKGDVVVGFPGERGMDIFIERVAEWEKVCN